MTKEQAIAAIQELFAESGIPCDRETASKLVDLGMAAKLAVLARRA